MRKPIRKFRTEDQEREFWARRDSTEYLDWSKGRRVIFPNLKPSTKAISLRLPESLVEAMKLLANKRDVPYQSLMKVYLAERITAELGAPEREQRRPRKGSHHVSSRQPVAVK